MKINENVRYTGEHSLQKMNVYMPEANARAAFLYLHGGGLEHGDMSHSADWAKHITDNGIAFISANYRMYPDAKYPDFICDAAAAVAYALKLARANGIDKLYVGGSSAGGYLSMMLCFDTHYLKDAGVDPFDVAGYLPDAGQPTAHFNVLKERGVDSRRVIIDESAPLYFIGAEEKYPPMRFIVSDNDMQNRFEQTMLVLSTMKHFGYTGYDHTVKHGKHCHYTHLHEGEDVCEMAHMIVDFVNDADSIA